LDNFVPVGYVSGVSPHCGRRASYYGVQFVPTNVFDGTEMVIDGNYSSYMSAYNKHRGNPSPLTITFLSKSYGGDKACVSIRVKLEKDITEGHVCHIVLWEDKVQAGSHTWRFTEREMPSYEAIVIKKRGEVQTIKRTFSLQGGWKRAGLGVSAFVQKLAGKQVLNGRATKLVEGIAVAPTSLGRVKALFN